MYIRDNKK